ncbi:[protein-PII] uridylyltransferase [Legionella septentrionalis]|uniref:[protein-PII] uridylyltransferase n=1 Tax=Legionella septentrionalis TaxID=2498109 RepID=UPI000F8E05F9|nr:[protein-PII] uridylyltransferase [Legionella septentrionalis]RUQ99556.1 [protein-PII] uridylyltransferase [Legionella septentrionalis]RUR11118.1 [protein-PII] uridylyltransferase [Legionella septentrionalis]RUR14417.1 [protein-PII] uridylyltransferase [Legionella septentrionalis]
MELKSSLYGTKNDKLSLKQRLKQFKEELRQEFLQKTNIVSLTQKLVTGIDELLGILFHKHELGQNNAICLLALGSYGRRELQLYSDIDLLLLHEEPTDQALIQRAQLFIQDCWDTGLEVSHQITTVAACAELANEDLSVISSILDMRLLFGRSALMEELTYKTHPLHMWRSEDFFFAKQKEQGQRYAKYGETAYNLEPNVKNGPGGLRDIQVLAHISKRHFAVKHFSDGIHYGFITSKEYEELMHCQHFLWRIRFALHLIAQKKEDRLLFDHQIKLAALFNYQDNAESLAIEQFMKAYFKILKRSRELNEMLQQWFAETIVYHQKQKLIPLNESFQLANDYIEIKHAKLFAQKPYTLLEIFLWIAKTPDIDGIRASTVRLIRQHLYLIDRRFCASTIVKKIFLEIFQTENNPYNALQLMSRYGVLDYYLEAFAMVTGQMQYDLFHVFTVDQHTLFVIRNLGRFLESNYARQFPLCNQLMSQLPMRNIIYLAALFHDIAKGRGGDHSLLAAEEAKKFSELHGLSKADKELLIWLVCNHLLMSHTAQRKDIYDPKTIQQFCKQFPEEHYLDYLYLLTVADICGTNPGLWNAWKDSLLKELYFNTKQAMQQKKTLLDEAALVASRQKEALTILSAEPIQKKKVNQLWQFFKSKYFLHESSEVIARHTKAILTCEQFPLVMIMPHHSQGGTEVFIYMPHRDERFTVTTTVLNNHHLTIQEATILTCDNQFDLDTYIILNENDQAFLDEQKTVQVQHDLTKQLHAKHLPNISQRRISRIQAHFKLKPQITFTEDEENNLTCLFLITADKPGLLARISHVFLREKIHLHSAKIATAGERVEDMFSITNPLGMLLTQEEQNTLRHKLIVEISNM